jgi:hypothetical protein
MSRDETGKNVGSQRVRDFLVAELRNKSATLRSIAIKKDP